MNLPGPYRDTQPSASNADARGRGVLVFASGGLGDAVLLAHVFPRFAALAEAGERVTLVLRRDARKMAFLFQGMASVEAVDYDRYAKSFWHRRAVRKQLGATRWRLIVNSDFLRHPKRDEHLIAALPADEKVAMVARPWAKYDAMLDRNRRLYARLFESGGPHVDKVLRWARFADFLSGTRQAAPSLRFDAAALPAPAPLAKPTAILIPFSAVREKQASPDLFADIVRALPDSFDIVIAGAPDDLTRNPDYATLLSLPRVRFEARDFVTLAALMRAARLVVSVDTAAMHLAAGVGAPTLCLASAAYVGEIVPYAPDIAPANVRFVYVPMACQGCLGVCIHPSERAMYPCVARLPREVVLSELAALLATEAAA